MTKIIETLAKKLSPENLVRESLKNLNVPDNVLVISIGKAAWLMAKGAAEELKDKIKDGIIVTKYSHSRGNLPPFQIMESRHPIPDENSIRAARKVIETINQTESDVLLLLSGGASSLFELPLPELTLQDLIDINEALIRSGATIDEINTVRKHLSSVKGGRLAEMINPRHVTALILSDVIGDRADVVGSGPVAPDLSTSEEAKEVLKRYNIQANERILRAINRETPKHLTNSTNIIIGNLTVACETTEQIARERGYNTLILTTTLNGEAREVGKFISSIAREIYTKDRPVRKPGVIILGGETTVHVRGNGTGGRNQELALSASMCIAGMKNVAIASFGTDGTDGPTDAAGGIVDGKTVAEMIEKGINPEKYLDNNDSYHALNAVDCLIKTGPTGTNLNDVIMALVT